MDRLGRATRGVLPDVRAREYPLSGRGGREKGLGIGTTWRRVSYAEGLALLAVIALWCRRFQREFASKD